MSDIIYAAVRAYGTELISAALKFDSDPRYQSKKYLTDFAKQLPRGNLSIDKTVALVHEIVVDRIKRQRKFSAGRDCNPTITERLHNKRIQQSQRDFDYRTGVNDTLNFVLTAHKSRIGVEQTECVDWHRYKGNFRGRPCNYYDTIVFVPVDRYVRVVKNGLSVIAGMMTLDASPLIAPRGYKLYAATWIEQGRGNSLKTVHGYVGQKAQDFYHAETAEKAINGVGKKAAVREFERVVASTALEALVETGIKKNVIVRLQDAIKVGSCISGIKNWCHQVGLAYEDGSAPLSVIWEAYKKVPAAEAKMTILHALRRTRGMMV